MPWAPVPPRPVSDPPRVGSLLFFLGALGLIGDCLLAGSAGGALALARAVFLLGGFAIYFPFFLYPPGGFWATLCKSLAGIALAIFAAAEL